MKAIEATKIAYFNNFQGSVYAGFLVFFSFWYFAMPFRHGLSFHDFLLSSRYMIFWPLALIGALYMLFIGTIMALRIIIFKGLALYSEAGALIFIFPFIWSVKIEEIVSIAKFNREAPFPGPDKIVVQLRNGKAKYIGTQFMRETREEIIAVVNEIRGI